MSELNVYDPQGGRLIASVPRAARQDVQLALSNAEVARVAARDMSAHRRTQILQKIAKVVDARREEFAQTIALEGVKTIPEAPMEVSRCTQTLLFSAEEAHHLNGQTIAFDQRPGGESRTGYFFREPISIIVAITCGWRIAISPIVP